jgi:hypothetical protein
MPRPRAGGQPLRRSPGRSLKGRPVAAGTGIRLIHSSIFAGHVCSSTGVALVHGSTTAGIRPARRSAAAPFICGSAGAGPAPGTGPAYRSTAAPFICGSAGAGPGPDCGLADTHRRVVRSSTGPGPAASASTPRPGGWRAPVEVAQLEAFQQSGQCLRSGSSYWFGRVCIGAPGWRGPIGGCVFARLLRGRPESCRLEPVVAAAPGLEVIHVGGAVAPGPGDGMVRVAGTGTSLAANEGTFRMDGSEPAALR